jgi:hypothetical protein
MVLAEVDRLLLELAVQRLRGASQPNGHIVDGEVVVQVLVQDGLDLVQDRGAGVDAGRTR